MREFIINNYTFMNNLFFMLGSWRVFPLTLVAFIITAIKANIIERRKKHYKKYNNDDFKDTNLLLFFLITAFSLALIFATIMTIWLNNGN